MTESDAIAEFLGGVRSDTLPQPMVDRAKRSVLDFLGCLVCGARSEWSSAYYSYVDAQGPGNGDASVALVDRKFSAYYAAMLNGTFAHATELSETYTRAVVHPGNTIIPAVLAGAERDGLPGRDVLTAVAAGYEVLIRLGLSLGREFMLKQGMHIPAMAGTFGSAAAMSNLYQLDAAGARDVLGIVATLVPTFHMIAAKDDATVKDLFEGHAAASGLMSLDLHQRGITGIHDPFGSWGRSLVVSYDPSHLTNELGERWLVDSGGLHFKERALLAMGQPAFDATRAIWEEHTIAPEQITGVVVYTSRRAALGGNVHPDSTVAAKASIPFTVAVSLAHQDAIRSDPHFVRTLVPAILEDPEVSRIADLVDVRVDDRIEEEFEVAWPMKFAARVGVDLADGRHFEAYEDIWPRSSTMNYDQVRAKFLDVTHGLLAGDIARDVADQVARLDEARDIRGLMRQIARGLVPAGSPQELAHADA